MFNAKSLLDALVSAGTQMAQNAGQQGQAGAGQANSGQAGSGQGGAGGMLGDMAGRVQQGLASGGGIGGMIGSVLSKASQGLQQAGQDVNARTGIGDKASDMLAQRTGKTPQELLEQAKGMIGGNQLAAGAAMGALGGLLFGTSSGRSIAASAAKMGGLALIGGLAYKAYQDYAAGKPVMGQQQAALPAPSGSGFEAEAATDVTATLFIRAMVSAAAADGHIDDGERKAILGGMSSAGFDPEANTWLNDQITNPPSVDDLVAEATTPELAAQVYTAARLAINPDTSVEKDYLAGLAGSLGLDAELVAHIDMAAAAQKV